MKISGITGHSGMGNLSDVAAIAVFILRNAAER